MNIKKELDFLIVYAKCQQIAATSGDADAAAYHERFVRQSLKRINRWADMAKAALAVAEHQATSGYDPSVDAKAYMAERGRLWDAFVAARAKPKWMVVCNEPADQGRVVRRLEESK